MIATDQIQRVIRECFLQAGPVYIFLPLDLSAEEVDADLLMTPLDLSPRTNLSVQEKALNAIQDALSTAKKPAILVDALAHRFDAVEETRTLVSKLKVPVFSTYMGKGIVDETLEMYVGLWNGEVGAPGVKEAAHGADLMIVIGYMPSDTNTSGFSRKVDPSKTIFINPFDVVAKGQTYSTIYLKPLLEALNEQLPSVPTHAPYKISLPPRKTPMDIDAKQITHSWLWPRMSKWLRPGDGLLGEIGVSLFGLCDIDFPPGIRFISQLYYASIGAATPAALGAAIAQRELCPDNPGRTILVTGDGSLAMTIQEIGTMIKQGITPVIFVVNNAGYTIERMIWGAREPYNDIVPTNYSALLPLYHHPEPERHFHKATMKEEMERLLEDANVKDPKHLTLVEIVVDKLDTTWALGGWLAVKGEETRAYLKKEGFIDAIGGWGLEEGGDVAVKWS
jgi:pyruvate decarboxylase